MDSLTQWKARIVAAGRNARAPLSLLALVVPFSLGASECKLVVEEGDGKDGESCEDCGSSGQGCSHDGEQYPVGATIPASDGCNTCTCTADGVACTAIGCLASCGGLQGASCPAGQYCNYGPEAQCGAADQTGSCQVMPEACDLQYDPVCGCDDQTYGNACAAASAGVSVLHRGECGSEQEGCLYEGRRYAVGDVVPSADGCNKCSCNEEGSVECTLLDCADSCGGIAGVACPEGQYCNYPPEAACGAGDQTGSCAPRPEACTFEYAPVCGCDGKTYGNACAAASAGVSVVAPGECGQAACEVNGSLHAVGARFAAPDGCNTCSCGEGGVVTCTEKACGTPCGGWSGDTCSEQEYCEYMPGAACGALDVGGYCLPRPEVCPDVHQPFTACDGKSYGNACEAAAAGAGVSR